jgi:hypothetical protein
VPRWGNPLFGNNAFVLIGYDGGSSNTAVSTDNGVTWSTHIMPRPVYQAGSGSDQGYVVFGAGKFLCVDSEHFSNKMYVMTSVDGKSWTTSEKQVLGVGGEMINIGYNGNVFAAVFKIYAPGTNSYLITTSVDGNTWSNPISLSYGTDPSVFGAPLDRLFSANGRFYLSSSSTTSFYTSDDGVLWNAVNLGLTTQNMFQSVIYDGIRYVILFYYATRATSPWIQSLWTSTNGLTNWTETKITRENPRKSIGGVLFYANGIVFSNRGDDNSPYYTYPWMNNPYTQWFTCRKNLPSAPKFSPSRYAYGNDTIIATQVSSGFPSDNLFVFRTQCKSPVPTPTPTPTPTGTGRAIFGFGSSDTNSVSLTNIVSSAGVVSSDIAGVGTVRYSLAAAGYGGDKAIFGFGRIASLTSITNLVSSTGVVATDTAGVGTVRHQLAAAGYGGDKAIFGYGATTLNSGSQTNLTSLVSNTGVVATDTTGIGTARLVLAAAGYGGDRAIFGYGSINVPSAISMTNLVSNTGVVATDTIGIGTARFDLAAAGYGGDKAIFGYGYTGSTYVSLTNLISNTGVVSSDTAGVGTVRYELAAAGYGGDKAIFGFGYTTLGYVSMTNTVSSNGVVATDTAGIGTARRLLAAASFGAQTPTPTPTPTPEAQCVCTWTTISVPVGGWNDGIFANGKFMLFDRLDRARVMTSTNGDVWTLASLPSDGIDKLNYFGDAKIPIAYGNGIYLTLATNRQANPPRTIVATSPDGITWNISLTDMQIFPGAASGYAQWSGVAFGAGKFVITYHNGGTVGIVTTTDGTDLTYQMAVSAGGGYASVTYINGYFFMLSYGDRSDKLLYSTDGLDWLSSTLPYGIGQWQRNIAHVFGQWFMIDESGRNDKLFVSTDLITWTTRLTGFGNSEGGAIVASDNILLSYGSGMGLYTSDGVVWSKCPGSVADISSGEIIFGNNAFIATYLFSGIGTLYRAICPSPTPTPALPGRAIFGYGYGIPNLSITNLVSNTGVVTNDVTGVGTGRSQLAAAGYGTDKAIFGYGVTNIYVSMTNLVSSTGIVSGDVTGVGTARSSLAAAGYGTDKAIFGYGYDSAANYVSMTNLVSNTGIVSSDTAGVGTARRFLAAAGYGTDKAIFGYGYGFGYYTKTNLVSNTGVVSGDVTGVGTARLWLAAAGYGTDKAIFGYGQTDTNTVSITNLVSNTGVTSADTAGVGTARQALAAAGYGTDKAIFGYGANNTTGTFYSMINLVTNTGVISTDAATFGTSRYGLAASSIGG